MKKKTFTVQEAGHKGGTIRAQRLSPERRREIALQGSMASKRIREERKLAKEAQNV